MSNIKKTLGRAIIISTYAIIFCIMGNMVMPAVIVETVHAQVVTSASNSQVQQQLSASDLALIAKTQADAKIENYKVLGLTKSEIAYLENPKNSIETLNKEMDQYVSYNKDGIASYNEVKVNATKKFHGTFVSIVKKQIDNYNKSVKNTKSTTISAKTNSTSSVTGFAQNVSEVKVTKTVLDRGIKIDTSLQITLPQSSKGNSAMGVGGNIGYCYAEIGASSNWWGYTLYANACVASIVAGVYGVAVKYIISAIIAIIFPAAGTVISLALIAFGIWYNGLVITYNQQCGWRGVNFGGLWTSLYVIKPQRVC